MSDHPLRKNKPHLEIEGIRAIRAIGAIGEVGVYQNSRSCQRKRPLAVGRIIAPSRRSKAPNDWGVGVPRKASDLPSWEVGLEL